MKKPLFIIIVSMIGATFLYWILIPQYSTNDFHQLNGIDQIKIKKWIKDEHTSEKRIQLVQTIDDPQKIISIIQYFYVYSEYWQQRGFTPPPVTGRPAFLEISFLRDQKMITFLTVGYSKSDGYFLQENLKFRGRYLNYTEIKKLMDYLNIELNIKNNSFEQN